MSTHLPEDLNKLAAEIVTRYGLDGVLLVALKKDGAGAETHASAGLGDDVPPHGRVEILDTLAEAAIELIVNAAETAEREAAATLLN